MNLECKNINNNNYWMTDIALSLSQILTKKINVFCYNSNLYNDYLNNKELEFSGFDSIKKYLQSGGLIIEKLLTKEVFIEELSKNLLVVCVDSAKFNLDKNLTGGHFVIVNEAISDNECILINPKKKTIEAEIIDINHILSCMSLFGSWRICVKV